MTSAFRRPSPATIIAVLALFVALGGDQAFAGAAASAKKFISGKQIKKRSIAADRLTAKARKQLRGATGPAGAKGDTGPAGAKGDTGPVGPTGVVGAITVQREDFAVPDSVSGSIGISVTCPQGTRIIGGGSSIEPSASDDVHPTVSAPFHTDLGGGLAGDGEPFDAWRIVYRNPTGGTATATAHAFAICAQA